MSDIYTLTPAQKPQNPFFPKKCEIFFEPYFQKIRNCENEASNSLILTLRSNYEYGIYIIILHFSPPKNVFTCFPKLQVFKTPSFKVSRAASAHHAASAVSLKTFLDKFCQAKLAAGGLQKEAAGRQLDDDVIRQSHHLRLVPRWWRQVAATRLELTR